MEAFLACLNTNNAVNPMSTNFDPSTPIPFPNGQLSAEGLSPLERAGQELFHSKYNCAQ